MLVACLLGAALLRTPFRWPASLVREYIEPDGVLDEEMGGVEHACARNTIVRTAHAIVADMPPCDAAALRKLNAGLFEQLAIRYDPQNTRAPNQPIEETLLRGAATCTGLSIVLCAALRGLGVPARVAGTPMWNAADDPLQGNHNWVEAFVFTTPSVAQWTYLGAAEDTALSDTWFTERTARVPQGVFAARMSHTDGTSTFPLVWQSEMNGRQEGAKLRYGIAAVDRSAWYRRRVTRKLRICSRVAEFADSRGYTVRVIVHEAICADEIAALVDYSEPLGGSMPLVLADEVSYEAKAFLLPAAIDKSSVQVASGNSAEGGMPHDLLQVDEHDDGWLVVLNK